MDHRAFEDHMIDYVNSNATSQEQKRDAMRQERLAEYENVCRCKRRKAVRNILLLTMSFIFLVMVLSVIRWMGFLSADVSMGICAVTGPIIGGNVSRQVRVFKHHRGGRGHE